MPISTTHKHKHPHIAHLRCSLFYPTFHPHNKNHAEFCAPPDLNGCVRDSECGSIYCVPPDCCAGLYSPALLTIPLESHTRSVSLKFEEPLGLRFHKCTALAFLPRCVCNVALSLLQFQPVLKLLTLWSKGN